jgi:hypothetical protein
MLKQEKWFYRGNTMEDWKLWRIWFCAAFAGGILLMVLPLFGYSY